MKNKFSKSYIGNIFSNGMDITGVFNSLCSMYQDTTVTMEEEKTKREKINAEKEAKLEAIKTQKEFFLAYLEKTYDERARNFTKLFKIIDDAIAKNNIQQLAMSLDSLNKLAAESPFKVIADINALSNALEKKIEFDF
ncbi:hypothetical protein EZS27_013971 [termite gut metagenome]|uniref:Uncharacterized protein n=1 Tax=termite gut metagenome TaxID=433724 RepID=A0A5J4RVG4_9ZZZZ